MGEVVEVGPANGKLKVGDRVVVPFTIICGECDQCQRGNYSVCERTNSDKVNIDNESLLDLRVVANAQVEAIGLRWWQEACPRRPYRCKHMQS